MSRYSDILTRDAISQVIRENDREIIDENDEKVL